MRPFNTACALFFVLKRLGRLALPLFLCFASASFAQSANTLSGNTNGKAPAASVGIEGNYFIDVSTGQIYGPKVSGQWPPTPNQTSPQPGYNIIYSGPGGPPNVWQTVYGKTLSGNLSSPDATGTTAPLQYYIGADTVTGIGLAYMQVEGGLATGFAGGRIGIQGKLVVNGVPSLALTSGLTGVTGQTTLNANLTGTTGVYANYLGTAFGGNSQVIATGNATFASLVNGHEFDVELQSGGSAAEKHAASFVATANDAQRAVYDDSALEIADQDQAGFVGWKYGISFGGYAHRNPFNNTSTYIVSQQRQAPSTDTPTANIGIDFSATTFTTAFEKSTGYIVDGNGNTITTSTIAPTMATNTMAISGLITAPTLAATGEGVAFVAAANGAVLEGDGTTYDVGLYDNAGVIAAGVVHGQSWFEVPNLLALGTNTFLTSGDVLSVSKSNNGDGGITITNPAGSGNTAAFTAVNLGNSTSVNEALISLNGGFSTATNGANNITISTAGTAIALQVGSNVQGTNVAEKLTSTTVTLNGAILNTGTAPTLTTGSCSGSAWVGGTTNGRFTAATCSAGTYIISSLPAATNGYNCYAQDETTTADTLKQTAQTTTSCTLTSTTAASDVIGLTAFGY